jgi:hypothetical protein
MRSSRLRGPPHPGDLCDVFVGFEGRACGQSFFTKRKIYNEGSAQWQYKGTANPAR